jgi:hypothetical protein
MTIIHKGIRRKTSDVTEDYGLAYYAQNVRFRRVGEMGRRGGIGKTDMAQQAGPVLLIGCGSYYEPYVIQVVGSTAISTPNPVTLWADPELVIPDGETVKSNCNPALPASGSVAPTWTYDGLSGNGYVTTITPTVSNAVAGADDCCLQVDWTVSGTFTLGDIAQNTDFILAAASVVWSDACNGTPYPSSALGYLMLSKSYASGTATYPVNEQFTTYLCVPEGAATQLSIDVYMGIMDDSFTGSVVWSSTLTGDCGGVDPDAPWQVNIIRVGGNATSFDVWAKKNVVPENDGDGVFVANVPIAANETSVTYAWTAPSDGSWKFLAIPRYLDQVGLAGQIGAQ